MPDGPQRPKGLRLWTARALWFVALWCAGLGAVSALAYVLRLWIAPR